MKLCPACKTNLPAGEYYDEPTRADGLSTLCRGCIAEKAASKRDATFVDVKGWHVFSPSGLRGSVLKARDDSAVVHFKTARTATLPVA